MNYKIAVVTPTERDDFYCDTVLDGLALLKKENSELQFFYPEYYPHPFGNAFTKQFGLSKEKLADFAKKADIIISGIGKPKFITGDMVKDGVIIIDAGTSESEGKLSGDADFDSVSVKASHITPVPGGVGPVTVAMLFQNLVSLEKIK